MTVKENQCAETFLHASCILVCRDQVGGVEVVFVGRTNADTFIITEAQQLRKSGCPYVSFACQFAYQFPT